MKKRDFLFLGLALVATPMVAQDIIDGPTRTKDDAKVIFEQGFEKDWDKFQTDTIDSITELYYYKQEGGTAQSIDSKWAEDFIQRTDSVIYLKNGVMRTDNKTDVANNAFGDDVYMTKKDNDGGQRHAELETAFGIDAGEYYFSYSAKPSPVKLKETETNSGAYSNGVTANYRRNLFVRGIPVEERSSYRLTLFLKVNQPIPTDVVPTFYADVMKGYFHSEKPFYTGNSKSSGYSNTYYSFEYSQTEFIKNWDKVTFMTYYINDSVNKILYKAQYYWPSDWTWHPQGDDTLCGFKELNYIKQPEKYFVRLSFPSDSTDYMVDNISLTKSWIGGVEYYSNKIRVDFGYKTNLKDLANAQFSSTNIAAIELPSKYFTVTALYRDETDTIWANIPISSAEYHGDGYMYMWTENDEDGSPVLFDIFDSVFVSFTNPDSLPLQLKYTDDYMYPMADDTAWVNKGKIVPDFHNEIATPNPYAFDGVYSMFYLPPVVNKLFVENNSFQLDPNTDRMRFGFSREVVWKENAAPTTLNSAMLKVEGNGKTEYWFPQETIDGNLTIEFVRPSSTKESNGPLAGDYKFTLTQIEGLGTDAAAPVSYNYSFGDILMPSAPMTVDFNEFDEDAKFSKGICANAQGIGFSVYKTATKIKAFTGKYQKGLMFGNYAQAPGGKSGSEKTCMKLYYTFTAEETGSATIEFGWTGCNKSSWNDDCNMHVTISEMADGEVVAEIGRVENLTSGFKPEEGGEVNEVGVGVVTGMLEKGKEYRLTFLMPNESGDNAGHTGGLVLYYLNINSGLTIGSKYALAFDDALAGLNETLAKALANANDYTGSVYSASNDVKGAYAEFKAVKSTSPTRWNNVTDSLKAANTNLKNRIKIVDDMWAVYKADTAKINTFLASDAKYSVNPSFIALKSLLDDTKASFVPMNATDDSIKAVQKSIEDASAALDTRKTLMSDFNSELARALAEIENKEAVVDIAEYAALQEIYDEFKDTDIYTTSDEVLTAARDAVKGATDAYVSQCAAMKVRTVRLKELAKEATTIGVEFDEAVATEYAARVENANDEDLGLENVYKQAIKVAILKKIVAEQSVENIDLTGFIRNFNLYITAKIADRVSSQCPAPWGASSDPLKTTEDGLYNIMNVTHQYNKVPIWVVICDNEITDLYPGWTVKSTYTGNAMVTPDDDAYSHFKAGQAIFDGQVAMDWNSKAELSTVVEGLPAGLYKVGFDLKNNTNDATKLTVTADGVSKSISCAKGASGKQAVDSVMVTDGSLDIYLNLQSGEGWSTADDFTLNFINKVDYDYAAALAAEEQKLSEMITFVDAFGADAAVDYIGLDGRMMTAPKAGQIAIKVSKNANGARAIQKVMFK